MKIWRTLVSKFRFGINVVEMFCFSNGYFVSQGIDKERACGAGHGPGGHVLRGKKCTVIIQWSGHFWVPQRARTT